MQRTRLCYTRRMLVNVCIAKLHRATVTDADLEYIGSITIDEALLEAAGLLPGQMVQITNLSNAALWRTYIVKGEKGKGEIILNGPPALLFKKGDKVNIERSIKSYDEIGGHIVSGHVDTTAEIVKVEKPENNHIVTFKKTRYIYNTIIDTTSFFYAGKKIYQPSKFKGNYKKQLYYTNKIKNFKHFL